MKIKNIFLTLAGGLLLTASCNTLEVEPTLQIEGSTAIVDSISVERAALGAYTSLQSEDYYGLRYLLYQDVYMDVLQHAGTFTTDQQVSARIIQPSNVQIRNTWGRIYTTINRTNDVIQEIEKIQLLPVNKTRYIAEMRFIRALCYFDLLKTFGAVPIHTTPTKFIADIKNLPRATEAAVYQQIIDDLTFVEANLTSSAGVRGPLGIANNALPTNPNRAVRGSSLAATALLARVYLQQGDNVNAALKANQVIAANAYTLQTSFANIFNQKRTTEAIFELDFTVNDQNTLALSSDPSIGGQKFYFRAAFMTAFRNSGTAGDTRFVTSTLVQSNRNRMVKYFRTGSGDDNVPIIRLAEMFLIRAEAVARQGAATAAPDAAVIADINRIRTRAGLLAGTWTTNAAALTEILAQRGFEFAGEGHRFADMKRFGTSTALFRAGEGFRNLWPIPLQDIEINNLLVQNPGY
jgi:hypothetical protein